MKNFKHLILGLMLGSLLVVGCGGSDSLKLPGGSGKNSANATASKGDDMVTPPEDYYKALLEKEFNSLHQSGYGLVSGKKGTQTLFINFSGVEIKKGFSSGESFILCAGSASLPKSDFSSEDQKEILEKVNKFFAETNVRLSITLEKPDSGTYTTVHVTRSYKDLGCQTTVLGVAPFDKGNSNPSDTAFVFVELSTDKNMIAAAISHEAGHTFGLDHVDNHECLMHRNYSGSTKGFRVGQISSSSGTQDSPELLRQNLGATTDKSSSDKTTVSYMPNVPEHLASLPGLNEIAGLAKIIAELADDQVLDISTLKAELARLKPPLANFAKLQGLDKVISAIVLASSGAKGTNADGNQDTDKTETTELLKSVLTSIVDPNSIVNQGINAAATVAGVPGVGTAISFLGKLFGFDKSATTTDGTNNTRKDNQGIKDALAKSGIELPNFAELLEIHDINNMGQLIQFLRGHAQVINANFVGEVQLALLSMLKVAYAQAFTSGQDPNTDSANE